MYYKINFLIVLFTFSCCEKEEVKITPKLNNLENKYPKIGDDLYLKVSDFKDIRSVAFRHKNRNLGFLDQSGMVTKVDEETIKVKMPVMYHEDVYVESFEEKLDFKIYGMIPIVSNLGRDFTKFQIINSEIAFALHDNNKIYKSVDKYYNWNEMRGNESEEITNFYFKNENFGIITYSNKCYLTEDGLKTTKFLFEDPNFSFIRKIVITYSNDIIFLNDKNKVYIYTNNEIFDIYNKFELDKLTVENSFYDFYYDDSNLILSNNGLKSILIKFNENAKLLEENYLKINFLKDKFISIINTDIYSVDINNFDKKIIGKSSDLDGGIRNINFFNENNGIGFVSAKSSNIITDNFIVRTYNGGESWQKINFIEHYNIFSSGNTNIISSDHKGDFSIFMATSGKTWKYIGN